MSREFKWQAIEEKENTLLNKNLAIYYHSYEKYPKYKQKMKIESVKNGIFYF